MKTRAFTIKQIILAASAFALSMFLPAEASPASAAESSRIVRVAFPIQEGLTELDENGNYRGYTYEYLEGIARYTGWEYELVRAEGTGDEQPAVLLDMLDRGEVDLMGGMLYNEALGEKYHFSSQSYGVVETVLQTVCERAAEVRIDANNMQTLRIAVLKTDGPRASELEAYCAMNLIEPEYILCKNVEEQMKAVYEKRADVLLNTSMHPLDEVQTIASFAPKPFYFVVSRQADENILPELNNALQHMVQADAGFSNDLFQKYFLAQPGDYHPSAEEREYIRNVGTLRVGALENQPPFFTPSSGELKGIAIDFIKLLEEKTGLSLELIFAPDAGTLYQMAADGQIDLISNIPYHYENARRYGLSMTEPYLTSPYVLVIDQKLKNPGEPGNRLALSETSLYQGYTIGDVVRFRDMSECMRAVRNGDADYTYVDSCTAQYFSNLPEFWDLRRTQLDYEPRSFCFGLTKPVDPTLLSILDKAILSITVEQRQEIITKNTVPEHRLSFYYILREYPVQIFSGFLLLLGIILMWGWQRLKSHKRLQLEMDKRDQLYALMEEHFFEYRFKNQSLFIQNPLVAGTEGRISQLDFAGQDLTNAPGMEFLKAVRSGNEGTLEIRDTCVDGEQHWLRITQKTILNAQGEPSFTLGKVKIIDQEKSERDELITKAERDGLTGLYNVRTFRNLTENSLAEQDASEYSALLLMDIDHFKIINDRHGHVEGDRALVWLASLIQEIFGENGLTCRYGGDEFIVFLPNIPGKERLTEICDSFCKAVGQRSENAQGRLTVSLGGVLFHPRNKYETLFTAADLLLYQAKEAGRNSCVVQTYEEMAEKASPDNSGHLTKWLDVMAYQAVMQSLHTIAFEYDPVQNIQRVSPFIDNYLAGNYDGRLISDVMVEDGIIHPEDLEKSLRFQEQARAGHPGEMTLRLLTPNGDYRWFHMVVTNYHEPGGNMLMIGVLEDVQERMKYQELLRQRAENDPVSGIYNKETFIEQTRKYLERERDDLHFLFRFDIDRFKLINELFGNAVGDRVLCRVGEILRELSMEGETFGRLGNDVFIMCVRREEKDTIALVEKIERMIQEYPISFRFFMPTGIVRIDPGCTESVNTLCDRAALAQHTVKGSYLRHFAFYDTSMADKLNREHALIANMENALKEEQFFILFQPQYDMRNGSIVGAEALVRWEHPSLGMISPSEFIPLFERNGFIIEMDEYVWSLACRAVRRWLDMGLPPIPVSVNVSRIHLYDADFCDKIIALCDRLLIPHSLLVLEITESAYTDRPHELFPIMDRLHEEGFIFSMDDFGSGYSSLNILKDIPVDVVKFDLLFLEKARKGEQTGRSILKNMIQLMIDLQLSVLAEGVETEEQSQFLQALGCYHGQGYLYCRPIPAGELEKLLQKGNGGS